MCVAGAGIAIIMLDEQVDPEEARGLFTGSPPPLLSTFHLGFSMLVNLYRIEDANPAFMISRSFAHVRAVQEGAPTPSPSAVY